MKKSIRRLRRVLALVLACSALVLAGCGGGTEGNPVPAGLSDSVGKDALDAARRESSAGSGLEGTGGGALAECAVALAEYPARLTLPREEDFTGEDGAMDYQGYYNALSAYEQAASAVRAAAEGVEAPDAFFRAAVGRFLTEEDGMNRAFSPLNVYFALAMIAEVTEGESRGQILEVLGAADLEALREQSNKIWNAVYQDDGVTSAILGSSVWLNDSLPFREEVLRQLSDLYRASVFSGQMGTEKMNSALREWLNQQTKGLLTEQAGGIETSPETALALAATLYFKSPWAKQFEKSATVPDTFHAAKGDRTAPFMRESFHGFCYRSAEDGFSAVSKEMESGRMWLILPDKGTDPAALVESGAAMDFLSAAGQGERYRSDYGNIRLSLPKFDVSADMDLIAGLESLGITDVFTAAADFSPLTDASLMVDQVKHAARVKIDEEGCEAAAFTVAIANLTAVMEEPPAIDFTLDRPFLFVVESGVKAVPLFAGVVEEPLDA